MRNRRAGRAGALAIASLFVMAGTALADSLAADGDQITPGVQTYVDLGSVAPGATISRDVPMTLFCAGLHHVDQGQIVTVSEVGTTVPAEGGSITATDATIGPVPSGWADDTGGISGCAAPMTVVSTTPSHVTIVAPTVPGLDYAFVVEYGRTFEPAGVADASSITGFTSVAFVLDVVDAAPADGVPPTFSGAPGDIDVVTTDPAGAVVAYALPSATDDTDPTPTVGCVPAPGSLFAVGSTAVTCTASDAAGNTATIGFTVTVHLGGVAWESPVHGSGTVINRGRSLPLKVRAWMDGAPLAGPARFDLVPCGDPTTVAMTVDAGHQVGPGRWMTVFDTRALAGSCYRVEFVVGDHAMGSFELSVLGGAAASRCAPHRWANRHS